jgi:hypothetical protein
MEVSFLDLYNEKVYDLLSTSDSSKLRVREHPQTGPFVEGRLHSQATLYYTWLVSSLILHVLKCGSVVVGLSWHKMRSYEDVVKTMQAGLSQRHVGETAIHPHSHRGHGIFSLVFKQVQGYS